MAKNLAQQRREEIISAAHKCFIAKGFHATGMADIAREFGMSAGHIYNYFPSKTAIIEEVISRGMEGFYKDSCALQESQGSYEETLAQVKRIFGDCFRKERIVLSLELVVEAAHDPELQKVLQKADVKHHRQQHDGHHRAQPFYVRQHRGGEGHGQHGGRRHHQDAAQGDLPNFLHVLPSRQLVTPASLTR